MLKERSSSGSRFDKCICPNALSKCEAARESIKNTCRILEVTHFESDEEFLKTHQIQESGPELFITFECSACGYQFYVGVDGYEYPHARNDEIFPVIPKDEEDFYKDRIIFRPEYIDSVYIKNEAERI